MTEILAADRRRRLPARDDQDASKGVPATDAAKLSTIGVAQPLDRAGLLDADLDTLATALHVKVDDALQDYPSLAPPRPKGGFSTKLADSELITLAVLRALLGFTSETRWLRYARQHPDEPERRAQVMASIDGGGA